MKFASFCVAFRNVNWNGKYNGCGAPRQHQCMSTYAKFCTGPTASIFATACLQAELGACLWNTTEGLSLAVRVGGYNDGRRCFPHFMCIFFFLSCLWCSELFHSWSFVLGTALFACLFPFLFRLLFPLWFPHPPPRVTKPVCTISLVSTASPPGPARDVVTPHYNTVCCVLHSRVAGSVLTAERWPPPGMQATDFDF